MKRFLVLITLLLVLPSLASATDWYVRPAEGDYGLEDGTDYDNAWDGLLNVVWGAGGVQPGDNLYVCGLHVHNMTDPYANFVSQADIYPISGNSDSERIVIRGDCPGNPGIVWGAYRNSFSDWTHIGDGIWETPMTGISDRVWYFEGVGIPNNDSHIAMKNLNSLAELRAHRGGAYYSTDYRDGSPFYVKLTDGGDPKGRVLFNEWGYDFKLNGTSYITFLNLKFYNVKNMFKRLDDIVSHIRWENCTLWYAEHSIIAFRNHNHHIEMINCDIAWAQNGIGFSVVPVNSTDVPYNITFSGNKIHHIAVRIGDGDGHAIAGQGSADVLIEKNVMYDTGTGITFYCWDENQSMKNITVRWNWVYNTHTNGGANSRGIEFNSGYGQGVDTNAKCYGNIVGPNVSDVGYRYKWQELSDFYNNICYDCGTSFYISNTIHPIHIKLRNTISLNPRQYHIYFASTNDSEYVIDSDYNLFYPISGDQFYFRNATYWEYINFREWQNLSKSGCTFDPHSLTEDPLFVNPAERNFRLYPYSPPIDKGTDVGLMMDFEGNPVPQGNGTDIGAYEHVMRSAIGGDVNVDGFVDIFDLVSIGIHFGKRHGQIGWNVTFDVIPNKEIDIFDVVYLATRFTSSEISFYSKTLSGDVDTVVNIPISINANPQQINGFALDIYYDSAMFEFQKISKGVLTRDWGSLYGNVISPGVVRIGGLSGGMTPVPSDSSGTLAIITFVVDCNTCGLWRHSRVCINNYMDGIAGMIPEPACTEFTFRRNVTSVTPVIPPSYENISIYSNPNSSRDNTNISIPISIQNSQQVNTFGLDLNYNSNIFDFQNVGKGNLTADWFTVDGNEISRGLVRLGGFPGAGTPVPRGSNGSIAIINLTVNCSYCTDGQQSQICINNYVDDVAGMEPEPACTEFTFTTNITPSIGITSDPISGGNYTSVRIPVSIYDNSQEIDAFGLDMNYSSDMFDYQDDSRGDLTLDWIMVDSNEISPGYVRMGGFTVSGNGIKRGSNGTLITADLLLNCTDCVNGQQGQFCIHSYVDDISGMIPEPACTDFTFRNNAISVSSNPASGGNDTPVRIPVSIDGNAKEMDAFGLDLNYSSDMLTFQNISRGNLTLNWVMVDSNEISPGYVRMGGFTTSMDAIQNYSSGILVTANFIVNCTDCISGQQGQICIHSYVADISGMTPEPSCTSFTYTS